MEKQIVVKRSDLLEVVRHLNLIVVSLDRVGSAYADASKEDFYKGLFEFFDNWDVFERLAESRGILSEYFSRELGEDNMEELERELQDEEHWTESKPKPTSRFKG